MGYSFITDPSTGKQTGVVLDMEAWSYLTRFHSEVLYQLGGNTFENCSSSPLNIFSGEVINPIVAEDFPTDLKGTEN